MKLMEVLHERLSLNKKITNKSCEWTFKKPGQYWRAHGCLPPPSVVHLLVLQVALPAYDISLSSSAMIIIIMNIDNPMQVAVPARN